MAERNIITGTPITGTSTGTLYSAKELDDDTKHQIEQGFVSMLKHDVEFDYKIDESLIGGFLALIDGKAYDNSLKARLQGMQTHILEEGDKQPVDEASQIGQFIQQRIFNYSSKPLIYTDGVVESSGDSIVHIRGLEHTQYGEIIEFENGVYGMAMDLEVDGVGAVLLNGINDVKVGSRAKGTNTVVEVPVDEQLLGRVIDPIGRPLDGEQLNVKKYAPIEKEAPTIMQRQAVNESLQTGLLVVDSMIPIGKGQRELIIGDRQTGKTAIALDAMLNQKGKNVICVYVAIGQKASTTAMVVDTLKRHGAMEYSVVVASPASDCPAMQYIAPYAGCSIAEFFMHSNRNVLIVYDDLSKHAVAYRTMSLLLKRPPGREAYPGDVFYLHSRLLERSARLSAELGGGSITALPIVETMAGDISAYIPTNVISITDGQIYLESDLFHSGIRPAVNVGLSVSRVGGSAQYKAMRKVSGKLRLALAQYRELAIFTQFGADIDPSTKRALDNGVRLTEAIKQKQYSPYSLSQQVLILMAYSKGCLSGIPVGNVQDYIAKMLERMASTCRAQIMDIERSGDLTEDNERFIILSLKSFAREYKDDLGIKEDDG